MFCYQCSLCQDNEAFLSYGQITWYIATALAEYKKCSEKQIFSQAQTSRIWHEPLQTMQCVLHLVTFSQENINQDDVNSHHRGSLLFEHFTGDISSQLVSPGHRI